MEKLEENCICDVKFDSCYVEKGENLLVFISFRNMIYWRSWKDKVQLFYFWIVDYLKGDKISFTEYLDKPRELVNDWIHIQISK